MEQKQWYQSKTIWAGVAGTVRGIYLVLYITLPMFTNIHLPPIPPAVDAGLGLFLGGATIQGRYTADTVIGGK